MAAQSDLEPLSIPTPLGPGFCPSTPSAAAAVSSSSSSHDSGHGAGGGEAGGGTNPTGSVLRDHLTVLARTLSRNSHRSSVASSRKSIRSVQSHVSTFQNVRFEPDPVKDISFWGGLALLISNMTGPGLVTLPIVAQSAGWLPTLVGFGVVGLLSVLSSLFICESMTEVPGNEFFQSNVEFSNLVLCFFGRRYHLFVQIVCFLAMQTTNIASIAVSAQLFDNLLIKLFHQTCGIEIYPHPSFVCVQEQLVSASPFSGVMIMTAGVLLAFSMILPLALLKLSENIWLQLVSFILILLIVLQWVVTFFTHGLDTTLVPVVGPDISQTFGTILFNYAFITTVPSWANAKQPSVSIHKTVGWGVGITTAIYLVVAIVGGMAFHIPANSSLIQAIASSPDVTVLSQITGYLFPIAALITSIPINIIVIRYNLIQSGACNMMWSNLLSGVLPWLIAIPCMTGAGLTSVINWSSLFLVSTANFIIPFILYIYSKRHREKLNKLPIIEMEQSARLSREVSRSSFSGHSRRGTSISGSIRRRLVGSGILRSSSSQTDLTLAPPTAIAAASALPVMVGLGTNGMIHHSTSEDNLAGDTSHLGRSNHRRYHSNQSTGLGLGEPVSAPYFSYSRDGQLSEQDSPGAGRYNVPSSNPRSQSSSVHRPSLGGMSTVILHDPISEMAQRKVNLPRRVSHKDKILSMISEKHKKAMEEQAKRFEDQLNEKPVPPMILLSQSTMDLDLATEGHDYGDEEYHRQDRAEAMTARNEKWNEKDMSTSSSEEQPAQSTIALKRMNRKSSIHGSTPRRTLTLPPSSTSPSSTPPSPRNTNSMLDLRNLSTLAESNSETGRDPSPAQSPPRSPSSPQRSALKRAASNSPGRPDFRDSPRGGKALLDMSSRPSMTLSVSSDRDSFRPEFTLKDSTRLGPGPVWSGSGSGSGFGSGQGQGHGGMIPPFSFQIHPSPSTPDSTGSMHSLERRVSFSDEPRFQLSPPELDRKLSFGSDTRRVVKAAMVSLTGSGGSGSGGNSPGAHQAFGGGGGHGSSRSGGRSPSREWDMKLLEDQEEDGEGMGEKMSNDDELEIGPELQLSGLGRDQSFGPGYGSSSMSSVQFNEARRDSLNRMAAAFVTQPGSFVIQTAPDLNSPRMYGSYETTAASEAREVPSLAVSMTEPTLMLPRSDDELDRTLKKSSRSSTPSLWPLSPSAPPISVVSSDPLPGRNHGRTVSASDVAQEWNFTRSEQYGSSKTQSTQSLKEGDSKANITATAATMVPTSSNSLAPAGSRSSASFSMHLTPPSPFFAETSQFDGLGPTATSGTISSLAQNPPPSPLRTGVGQLSHRHSFSSRPSRQSGSHKVLAAPFQGGNNYTIPGFSHSLPPSSSSQPSSPGGTGSAVFSQEYPGFQQGHSPGQSTTTQQTGSLWFGLRRQHSRNPSRSTLASGHQAYSMEGSSAPPSPHPSAMVETSGRKMEHLQEMTTTFGRRPSLASNSVGVTTTHTFMVQDTGVIPSPPILARRETHRSHHHHPSERFRLQDNGVYGGGGGGNGGGHGRNSFSSISHPLPQYASEVTALDNLYSLRAIPRWFPVSSLWVAWGSLGVLCATIGSTIVYDFVQLASGNDLVSGG